MASFTGSRWPVLSAYRLGVMDPSRGSHSWTFTRRSTSCADLAGVALNVPRVLRRICSRPSNVLHTMNPSCELGIAPIMTARLTGRLTRDPVMRSLAGGKNVTTFRDLPAMGSAGECAIPASPVSRDARRPGSPVPREVDVAFLWYSALSLLPPDELVGGDGERSSTAISDQSPLERCSSETAA